MAVEVRRGPDRVDVFEEERVFVGSDGAILLQVLGAEVPARPLDEGVTLAPGMLLVWYLWPDRYWELGALHDRMGVFLGHYVNLIRPPRMGPERWVIEDLFLDIWVPAGGPPRLLDEDELAAAVRDGWADAAEAEDLRRRAGDLVTRIESGDWPPRLARRWPVDLVPALRLLRDRPGTFYAARLSGRIIAYGLYLMGVVSATSILFAGLTDAFVSPGRAQELWKLAIAAEAVALLPLSLLGRLPATFWPRPPLTDERSLFLATLVSGLAVLGLNERAGWAGALIPVYATLGSAIFGVCRAWFDRKVPIFALAGILVALAALLALF